MCCRNPSAEIEDYVHRSISVEEFLFDESTSVSMGSRLIARPGLHNVLFKFSGDESIYDLATRPEVHVHQRSLTDGSQGNSKKFVGSVKIVDVSGDTIVIISSFILIDSSLRGKKAFVGIYSGGGALIARKTILVTLDE